MCTIEANKHVNTIHISDRLEPVNMTVTWSVHFDNLLLLLLFLMMMMMVVIRRRTITV